MKINTVENFKRDKLKKIKKKTSNYIKYALILIIGGLIGFLACIYVHHKHPKLHEALSGAAVKHANNAAMISSAAYNAGKAASVSAYNKGKQVSGLNNYNTPVESTPSYDTYENPAFDNYGQQ
uniref:Uncharacterized protein n=1 Tax=Megaviridae environmental sample TaxID=1737588 RepID=A0A5J6VKL7_9VIRU|nr:MAG: hypothetical protein [Megaviridae environmental sample]